jgi:uncharacterized protein
MFLELKKLFIGESAPVEFSTELNWSEETMYGQKPFQAPLRVAGVASNTAGIVCLRYQVRTVLKMPCDRCTAETDFEFVRNMEHILVDSLNGGDTGDLIVVEEGLRLDLDELVHADVMLEFPTKFLCREDCKGICPKCGINLNLEQCRCTDKPIDPRLEVLKKLLG